MKSGLDIIIADNSPVSRLGANSYLTSIGHRIVYEASNWEETQKGSLTTSPDVIVIDYFLPSLSKAFIDASLSNLSRRKNVLFYTESEKISNVMLAIESGAKGYLLKTEPLESLAQAVLDVSKGTAYFSQSVGQGILNARIGPNQTQNVEEISRLTPREREVLYKISEGLCNKEIASQFSISVRTVETHRERIMKKLNIHSIAGLTRFVIKLEGPNCINQIIL